MFPTLTGGVFSLWRVKSHKRKYGRLPLMMQQLSNAELHMITIDLKGVLKRNKASPLWDCAFPNGNRPFTGGNATFNWQATSLEDGAELVINYTGTLVQPRSVVDFGLGDGWLSSAADGTKFQSITVSTALGNAALAYEDNGLPSPRRQVVTRNGQKCLLATLSSILLQDGNAGFINFDTGAEIAQGDHSFMWSSTQHTLSAADTGKLCQIKQDRVGPTQNIVVSQNEVYVKQDNSETNSVAFDCYQGVTAKAFFIGNDGPQADGRRTDFGWCWKINTPDAEDGSISNASGKGTGPLGRTLGNNSNAPNAPTGIIKTTSASRPRYQKIQGYVGVGNNPIEVESMEELLYSFFWQVNGYIVVLGDAPVWTNCTRWTPLKPTAFTSANSWKLRLYKGAIGTYNGGGIFLFNPTNLNTPIASAPI